MMRVLVGRVGEVDSGIVESLGSCVFSCSCVVTWLVMSLKGGEWGVMEVERRGNKRDVGDGERKNKKYTSVVCRLPRTVVNAENVANHVAWLKIHRHVYNIDTCHFPRVEKRTR